MNERRAECLPATVRAGDVQVVRRRSTPRKRALLAVLGAAEEFLSAAELHERLSARLAGDGMNMGLATVYQQLRSLAAAGTLDMLRSDGGEMLYRLPRQNAHHHYLMCRGCGRALEIVTDLVEEWLEALGLAYGFEDLTHHLEVFGLCHRCRRRSSSIPQRPSDD